MNASSRQFPAGLRVVLAGLPLVLVLAGAWQAIAHVLQSPFLPPLTTVLARVGTDWFSGPPQHLFLSETFIANVGPTLLRLALGWVIGVAVGIILGLLFASSRALRLMTAPLIRLGMSTPSPALLPVAIAFFGLGTSMKVFFIAFGAIWPVLTNTVTAFMNADQRVLDSGRSLRLRPWTYFAKVRLPEASPQIMSGVQISVNAAILLIVVAELYAATSGVGFLIVKAQRNFDMTGMWSGIVMLCLIGVVFNALFGLAQGRLMKWHRQSRKAS